MSGEDAPAERSVSGCQVTFDGNVYTQDTIKKAAYRFLKTFVTEIVKEDGTWLCTLHFQQKPSRVEEQQWVRELQSEVLDQDLRATIGRETETVRNAVLALAFSRTGLQESE